MSRESYRQCRLTRKTPYGLETRVTWVPVEFSVPGDVIKLRVGGEWSDGWVVMDGPLGPVMDKESIDLTRRTKLPSLEQRRSQ